MISDEILVFSLNVYPKFKNKFEELNFEYHVVRSVDDVKNLIDEN